MAGSVNKVILVGNLGKDPEVRRMTSGEPVVNLSVATSESWRDKASGEKKEKTEWHRVVIFNKNLAEVAEKYLRKGAKVYLEGSLQTRKWTDKDGAEKYSTEVVLQNFNGTLVMLDGRSEGGGGGASGSAPARRRQPSSATRWMTRFRSSLLGLSASWLAVPSSSGVPAASIAEADIAAAYIPLHRGGGAVARRRRGGGHRARHRRHQRP